MRKVFWGLLWMVLAGMGGVVGCQRKEMQVKPEVTAFRPSFEGGEWIELNTPGLRIFVEGAQFAEEFRGEVVTEVKEMPSIPVPPGYSVVSPVVRFVVPREAIARIPETEGIGSLFRGVVVELPVFAGSRFYAAAVAVNGHPYGVLYRPEELKSGRIISVKVPLRYYEYTLQWKGKLDGAYLNVEVFALAPQPVQPVEVNGLAITCSNFYAAACSGLHKKTDQGWRWFLRTAKAKTFNVFGKSITIPRATFNEGQPEPINVVFVHGLQFGYSVGGGWMGPKPDQWDGFIQKVQSKLSSSDRDLVGFYAYIHSGGGGFSGPARDLQDVLRAVNATPAISALPRADIEFLIGHSMGGLIIRAYAHQNLEGFGSPWPSSRSRVARVATLASPYHGSFLADLGLQVVSGEDKAYLQLFAEYIMRKAGFQCGWGFLQDLASYVDQFKVAALDLGFTLPGIGQVTLEDLLPMQSLYELTYDWFAPLVVYIPRCGRVYLSPGDADFPAALRQGRYVRDLMRQEQGLRRYIYNYYVREFGSGNRFLSVSAAILALFHNDPQDYPGQPRVLPDRRYNDGAVWYRSGRGDGCCGSFFEVLEMPNARDHFSARAGDQEVVDWVANHVREVVDMWKRRFSNKRMFALVWGKAPDLSQIPLGSDGVLDLLSGVYSTNLDLLVWPVRPGRDALPILPQPGFSDDPAAGVWHMGDADHGGPERVFVEPKGGYEYYFVGKKVINGGSIGFGPLSVQFDVPLHGERARFVIYDQGYRIVQVVTPGDWGCSGLSDIDGCTKDPTEDSQEEPGGPGEEYWVIGKLSGGNFQVIDQSVEAVDTTIITPIGNGMCKYRTALKWPGPRNDYPLNFAVYEDVCPGDKGSLASLGH